MPTFNGSTLMITLDAGEAVVDAKVDLYSDLKEWVKTGDNMKYAAAFDTVGGDPTTATGKVSPFFFLRNDLGWRIRPAEENANVTIVGNLYGRDPALRMLVTTVCSFTVLVGMQRDASYVVETVGSGVTAQDKIDIANEVMDSGIEGEITLQQMLRLLSSVFVGNIVRSGNNYSIKAVNAAPRERVAGTVDSAGNRTITNTDLAP